MDFYYLICEEDDGFKFIPPSAIFSDHEEALSYFKRYRTELYKNVEIMKKSIPIEKLLIELVKSELNGSVWREEFRELILPNPNTKEL